MIIKVMIITLPADADLISVICEVVLLKQIYTYCDGSGAVPVLDFFKRADGKVRRKFEYQLEMLLVSKQMLREPHIKHFMIERYKQFYEFRIKAARKMVRVIFCERGENIVLLHAFYKQNKRDTENALEQSLKIYSKPERESLCPFQYLCEVIVK